jgi:hypothetical protein
VPLVDQELPILAEHLGSPLVNSGDKLLKTKGVIRIRKSEKDRQHNGQEDKQQEVIIKNVKKNKKNTNK